MHRNDPKHSNFGGGGTIYSARRGLVPDGGRSHWVKIGTRKGKLIVLCGFLLLLKSSLDSVLEKGPVGAESTRHE